MKPNRLLLALIVIALAALACGQATPLPSGGETAAPTLPPTAPFSQGEASPPPSQESA